MSFALQSSTCTTDEHHQVSYLNQDWGGGGGGGGGTLLHVEPFAGLAGLSTIAQLALALRFICMW